MRTLVQPGQVYGKLTVVERAAAPHVIPSGKRFVAWVCRCECGGTVSVIGSNLRSQNTTSCGCNRRKRK